MKISMYVMRIVQLNSKMVSLYNLMLHPFKNRGHCVVMDSAYMGDAMCQVGRAEWGINMVGTVQSLRTGGGRLGKAAINRTPVIMPLAALYFGVIFLRGHISVKKWTYCPLLRDSAPPFKNTCHLIK